MRCSVRGVIAGLGLVLATPGSAAGCLPPSLPIDELRAARAAGWAGESAAGAATALFLVECLASPDPELRDALAFEALQRWMRHGDPQPAELRALRTRLLSWLEAGDSDGFAAPFAALVLAEVARTDRIAAWMTDAEREQLVDAASGYLAGVRDYRGFDPREGWRHGVAHGADLVLQLVLNPQLDARQAHRMLGAVGSQVVPGGGHAYVHGEPGRLAAPVLHAAGRDLLDADDWQRWIDGLGGVAPADGTAAALARRHNLQAFLLVLYASLQEGTDAGARERLLPAVRAALRRP